MRDPRIPALRRLAPRPSAGPGARRPGAHWLLLAALLLAAAFIEVWETTTASELSIDIEGLRVQVRDGESRLALLESRASQAASRQGLQAIAAELALRPADPEQIVVIPERLVVSSAGSEWAEDGVAAAHGKVVDLLVPEARARN